jgi:hypothetical protein
MTHEITNELEQVVDGDRFFVIQCSCGQVFSSLIAPGLTYRRSARAAYRKHLEAGVTA